MSARALAAAPYGRTCDPATITSVGYLAGAAVLGTSCERPGATGIFVQQGGTWHQAGPPLSSSSGRYRRGRAEVLGLMPDGEGLAALVGLAPTGTKEAGAKEGARGRGAQPPPPTPASSSRGPAPAGYGALRPHTAWARATTWTRSGPRRRVGSSSSAKARAAVWTWPSLGARGSAGVTCRPLPTARLPLPSFPGVRSTRWLLRAPF